MALCAALAYTYWDGYTSRGIIDKPLIRPYEMRTYLIDGYEYTALPLDKFEAQVSGRGCSKFLVKRYDDVRTEVLFCYV